jgi:hypothetical protein
MNETTQGTGSSESTINADLQPVSIPADMTAEQAQAHIKLLKQDKDFGARFLAGSEDSREARTMDLLQRRALGIEPGPAASTEPQPGALPGVRPEPPPDEHAYHLPGLIQLEDTDAARTQFSDARSMAFEHGLTPGEFSTIAEQQAADLKRFDGLSGDQRAQQLDADMQKIWRDGYDRNVENVTRYLAEHPGLREKLVGLGLGHNKAALMILGDLAAARYGTGRTRRAR